MNATRARVNAASEALAALDADANIAVLRGTAAQVGNTLIETAADDALWMVLAHRTDNALTPGERARLRAAVSINWVETLNALGYKEPPPADTYGTSFVQALSTVIVERDGRNIDEVRAQVRELGKQLVALTVLPAATPSRFRKWLRRGSRVVRGLAVAAGVAAAVVVIGQAVMPAATAAAIAAAAAPLVPGHVIGTSVIVEVVNEVTKKSIEFALNAALGRDPDAADDEDGPTAAQRARQHLGNVSVPQIQALTEEWAGEHAKRPIAASRQLIGTATLSVHLAAVAAAGADWASAGLCDQLNAVLALLGAVDAALDEQAPDAAEIAKAFASLAEQVGAAQAQLNEATHP
ncbi:hypothetical protein A5713_00760 [Mycobacterium sp. E2497]|nr:hypothetical protein A5713_00760 [Mycobacterium sp. E2497]